MSETLDKLAEKIVAGEPSGQYAYPRAFFAFPVAEQAVFYTYVESEYGKDNAEQVGGATDGIYKLNNLAEFDSSK